MTDSTDGVNDEATAIRTLKRISHQTLDLIGDLGGKATLTAALDLP